MVGLGMDALIHWYELNLAEGHPDYRVLPVIKKTLDGLWHDSWLPKQNILGYDATPAAQRHHQYTTLNNLVSVAYAWYWMMTGDTTERDHGDLLFAHAFDDPDGYTWSGKQFSQEFEFSFDFVRYRQGQTTSSVIKANNPLHRALRRHRATDQREGELRSELFSALQGRNDRQHDGDHLLGNL